MPDHELSITEHKDVDLRGATIIDGFPSVGLVSTITANYLIDVLELEQVGVMDSPEFPTVSIVRNGLPMQPVRIYAGKGVAVFISEFQPAPKLIRPIAEAILAFAERKGATSVVSPEGLVLDTDADEEVKVYALGSDPVARERLVKAGFTPFGNGIITGVSGMLLNLSRGRNVSAIIILAEANPNYPDARAAAKVIEAIDGLLEGITIDVKPLYTEAENIEKTIRNMQKQAGTAARPKDEDSMYR